MAELNDQINSILNDPKSLEMLQSLASELFDKNEEPQATPAQSSCTPTSDFSLPDIGSIMKIGQMLKSNRDDERTHLLLALRPLVSEERRQRVDRAVKMLKIAELLPLLREAGIELF